MKFWMLQVRKSRVCGISVIFFQCRFMSETQLSMIVSDFGVFFISSWKWALLSNRGGLHASCLLDVRHCHNLSLYLISRKTYPNSIKWRKTLFSAWFRLIRPNFFSIFFHKNLASSVTRYHGQLSCTILEKTII